MKEFVLCPECNHDNQSPTDTCVACHYPWTHHHVDDRFKVMCEQILKYGYDTSQHNVRAKWNDGSAAHTKKLFSWRNEYDISKGLPLMSLRPTNWKKAIDEVLWIWQKKSNNVADLDSKIWDAWADESGTIGKAYGYQLAKVYDYGGKIGMMDQVDQLLWKLKNDPMDRAMIADMYNPADLAQMNLRPCAHGIQLYVADGVVSMHLTQRSQDVLVANNWNAVQYAALLMMFAKASGLKPGKLVHDIIDCHIYMSHEKDIETMLDRTSMPTPITAELKTDKTDFYSFTVDDFVVEGYQTHPQIKGFEVAE